MKISVEVNGMEQLTNHINRVKRMSKMRQDVSFQNYIKNKCWQTLQQVIGERLNGGTTNDEAISIYIAGNHIEDITGGFIIYNDARIPAEVNGVQNTIENYPNGEFNIALAFEYGVGIIGQNTDYDPNFYTPWDYNVKGYNFGWYLPKSVTGETGVQTGGYMGFEIYRYTADRITKNLNKWIDEYFRKEV